MDDAQHAPELHTEWIDDSLPNFVFVIWSFNRRGAA
jgi:hypothetical protein